MKLNSKRFWVLRISINFAPRLYTKMSLFQFVYTACDWLKAVGGKDGWEFLQPMGVATRSGQAHAF